MVHFLRENTGFYLSKVEHKKGSITKFQILIEELN